MYFIDLSLAFCFASRLVLSSLVTFFVLLKLSNKYYSSYYPLLVTSAAFKTILPG